MKHTSPLTGIQPKAVMSAEEIAAWEALPASEQLARLRAAISEGLNSGVSSKTMDELLDEALARHPHVRI